MSNRHLAVLAVRSESKVLLVNLDVRHVVPSVSVVTRSHRDVQRSHHLADCERDEVGVCRGYSRGVGGQDAVELDRRLQGAVEIVQCKVDLHRKGKETLSEFGSLGKARTTSDADEKLDQ